MTNYEEQVRHLIAYDNLDITLNSLHKKADRRHKDIAVELKGAVADGEDFGCAIAEIKYKDKKLARGMKEAIKAFCAKYPKQGVELLGMIKQKRKSRETHLFYGLEEGRRISSQDYVGAMTDCGLSEGRARELYPTILEISRDLLESREDESGLRRILIASD